MSRQPPFSSGSPNPSTRRSGSNAAGSGSGSGISAYRSTSDKPWNNDNEVDLMAANVNFHRGNAPRQLVGRVNDGTSIMEGTTSRRGPSPQQQRVQQPGSTVGGSMTSYTQVGGTGSASATPTRTRTRVPTPPSSMGRQSQQTISGSNSGRVSSNLARDQMSNNAALGSSPVPSYDSTDPRGSSYARYLLRQQQQQLEQQQQNRLWHDPPATSSNSSRNSVERMTTQRSTISNSGQDRMSVSTPQSDRVDRRNANSNTNTTRPPRGSPESNNASSGSRISNATNAIWSKAASVLGSDRRAVSARVQRENTPISDPEMQRHDHRSKSMDRATSSSSSSGTPRMTQEERQQQARELRAQRLRMERMHRTENSSTTTPTTTARSPAVEAYLSNRSTQSSIGSSTNSTQQIYRGGQTPPNDKRLPGKSSSFTRHADPNAVNSRIASNRMSIFRSTAPHNPNVRPPSAARSAHLSKSVTRALQPSLPSDEMADDDETSFNASSSSSEESKDSVSEEEDSTAFDESPWSVRVCVVSAVDLPTNVVPNIPLSPVLKLGLTPLVQHPGDQPKNDKESTNAGKKKSHRVRCTACKVLSKRDNGSVEFHEELRWDRVRKPQTMGLSVELCVRGVLTPTNIDESPSLLQQRGSFTGNDATSSRLPGQSRVAGSNITPSGTQDKSRIGRFFGKGGKSSEMATANAAAAVAKFLVEDSNDGSSPTTVQTNSVTQQSPPNAIPTGATSLPPPHQNELDVHLSSPVNKKKQRKRRRARLTEDVPLGSVMIPLTDIPQIDKVTEDSTQAARIERWYELDNVNSSLVPSNQAPGLSRSSAASKVGRRNPSILLEISFYPPHALDDSEDDMDDEASETLGELPSAANTDKEKVPDSVAVPKNLSFQKRQSIEVRHLLKQEKIQKEENLEDPVLEPGVVDYICVVGARDIGNQKQDDGSKGWVNSTPDYCVLEQFPPDNDFHSKNGRAVALPEKVEWFCFPEGCRLWRGTKPPSHEDLNLKRFSASSPPNGITSVASFDACLNCTTSVSWFVIASSSDEYGAKNIKTYGVVVRFYVAAPPGIDPTQDDFAQMVMMSGLNQMDSVDGSEKGARKRLWVPIGICLTSTVPIVGAMEAMLLRLCETLSLKRSMYSNSESNLYNAVHRGVANLIVNYQKPIHGVVNCSIPFLQGERIHLSLPSSNGLPPLPHGNSVASVCRLLGPDGLNFLLAAILTECKVLMHSDDVANLALVAEVITALIFPFNWSLPYIPVLPAGMLEFVEAPLSYLLGVPSCCMKQIDPNALEDVVVVNLDNSVSSTRGVATKVPTPLPAAIASNISHAVYRLLRAEEDAADGFGATSFQTPRSLPRLENESLAEREFRITVALEICGLVRGYQDCLVFASTSQPVFNRDKFLKKAPALYEERRVNPSGPGNHNSRPAIRWVLSPRSKRFLSLLVNCQHFQQFLETLGNEDSACFHEIIGMWYKGDEKKSAQNLTDIGFSRDLNKALTHLTKYLRKAEEVVPTYAVEDRASMDIGEAHATGDTANDDETRFPNNLLNQIVASNDQESSGADGKSSQVHSISVQYLLELEKNPWRYKKLFDIPCDAKEGRPFDVIEKVKLRDAIGERRYRAWQIAKDHNVNDPDTEHSLDEINPSEASSTIDLTSLLTSATEDTSETSSLGSSSQGASGCSLRANSLNPEQQRVADAKDRDVLRRCLERAYSCGQSGDDGSTPSFSDVFVSHGRDLVAQAEVALRNPSAQRFLLSILRKRSHDEYQRKHQSGRRLSTRESVVSRLEPVAFECIVRLSCAMLDSCMETKDYEPAYCLLSHTTGLYTLQVDKNTKHTSMDDDDKDDFVPMYVTARIGLHPIFAELGLWEKVMNLHVLDRQQNEKNGGEGGKSVSGSDSLASGEEDAKDLVQYEAAVATLYEMLGYGIPAEELARFATCISEKQGWFSTERGRALLLLARRVSIRREQSVRHAAGQAGDLGMMQGKSKDKENSSATSQIPKGVMVIDAEEEDKTKVTEIGWCHPSAPCSRRLSSADQANRPGTQNLLDMLEDQKLPKSGKKDRSEYMYMKRSAVTSLASFGDSVVVTGGLDGGVFLAHTIIPGSDSEVKENGVVRGLHLDWGSSGSRSVAGSASTSLDGEYGVGAVSCLAAAKGAGYRAVAGAGIHLKKDTTGPMHNDDILTAMEGSRVVAGTTCGDLRVWSVKDVYSAITLASGGDESVPNTSAETRYSHSGGEGPTSSYAKRSDYSSGSSFNRLKFSLRGRALSGHRGGVTCIDVPSHVYHPDSVVTGGADGLIKLWSLRTPTGGRKANEVDGSNSLFSTASASNLVQRLRGSRGGDALSILSGHGGRILCVKTAWHGDRLLSGGADRTIRIWDLVGSGEKCLNSLSGHFGWVTKVRYWGPNTIVSASTDRSIALWDARVRCSPLFVLRHHHCPISDLLVGSRTDPLMVSAASDGRVTTWDFRTLSGAANNMEEPSPTPASPPAESADSRRPKIGRQCKVVRIPAATMNLHSRGKFSKGSGPVLLSFGANRSRKTVLSVGSDAVMREWEVTTGQLINEYETGHCDMLSSFSPLADSSGLLGVSGNHGKFIGGTITSSWDGTIRMRKVAPIT